MSTGAYQREDAKFRLDPGEVELEPGRFHLYVSPACPWSHRAIIARLLGGRQDDVAMHWVEPWRDRRGWAFGEPPFDDPLHGWRFLGEAYEATVPGYEGRISVPVLWDTETGRIAGNESADLVPLLAPALYPEELRDEIDRINERVYSTVNNGVYRAGFAKSQEAYDEAFTELFASLDWLEELLGERRYLAGDVLTAADWRLWVTLVRFDAVYHTHFRCNGKRIVDFPNLWAFARELHAVPGVAATIEWDQIKQHYYTTHDELNPKRIVPLGPLGLDWTAPHGRG